MFIKSYNIHSSSCSQQTQWAATSGLGLSNDEERDSVCVCVTTLSNSASI